MTSYLRHQTLFIGPIVLSCYLLVPTLFLGPIEQQVCAGDTVTQVPGTTCHLHYAERGGTTWRGAAGIHGGVRSGEGGGQVVRTQRAASAVGEPGRLAISAATRDVGGWWGGGGASVSWAVRGRR